MKMIKRLLIYETVFLIFAFFIYFEFSFMVLGVHGENEYNNLTEVIQKNTLIKSDVLLKDQTLVISEEIIFVEPTSDIWLNIPSNLFAVTKINPINIENCNVEMLNEDLAMHITLSEKLNSITLDYEVKLENKREILSFHENEVFLTEFLITPAPFVKGQPVLSIKSSFGDPFAYQMQDYYVSLNIDSSYNAFSAGMVSEKTIDDRKIYIFNTHGVRDFPVVLFKNVEIVKNKIRDIDVYYIGISNAHDEVVKAFNYIENKLGNYPYKELYIISAPIDLQGMEFSQMVFISDKVLDDKPVLNKIIHHEIFHQWIYGVIGTDQINEPFMDEGMVDYMVMDFAGKSIGHSYNSKLFNSKLNTYKSKSDYYRYAYKDGGKFFESLSREYGEQFDNCLKIIFQKYNGGIITQDDFLKELKEAKIGDD